MTIDKKINQLKRGESVVISKTLAGYCFAERSTNGKKIRFVRHIKTSTGYIETVFKTTNF